jgi:hypothetical protein
MHENSFQKKFINSFLKKNLVGKTFIRVHLQTEKVIVDQNQSKRVYGKKCVEIYVKYPEKAS